MRLATLLLGLIQLPCHAAPPSPDCEVQSQTYDSREVSCTIPAASQTRRFEFIARFSGSHDDTRASIRPSLSGQPLVCDEGSKTSLFAEDGDVSLQCRFTLQVAARDGARLLVTVRWSHAEYTDFQLVAH